MDDPANLIDETFSAAVPRFMTLTDLLELLLESSNVRDDGVTDIAGDAGGVGLGALPLKVTLGLLAESLTMVSIAAAGPPTVGLKLTLIVHEPLGGIGSVHVLV